MTTADQQLESPANIDPVSFAIRAVGRTHPGLCRDVNEDSMYLDDELGLYLVMDGMGGHASGQIASDLAVRTVVQSMKSGEPVVQPGEEPLTVWLKAANQAIFDRAQVEESCRGMGTTAVGIRCENDIVHICHCGDSRAYLLRQGELNQLTRDHSLENLYKDKPELAGQLGPAASNVIVRAIGLEQNVEIDHRVMAMENGDVFLLCCDGLSDLVADWMVKEIMTSGETLDEVADNLVRAANANGGTDNITVLLIAIFAEQRAASDPGVEGNKTIPGF